MKRCIECRRNLANEKFGMKKGRVRDECKDCQTPRQRPSEFKNLVRAIREKVDGYRRSTACVNCKAIGVEFYHPCRGVSGNLIVAGFDTLEGVEDRLYDMVGVCPRCKHLIQTDRIKTDLFD